MKLRKSYKGVLKGVKGVWTDEKPKGLEKVEEIEFWSADKGKVFKKGDKIVGLCVILKDGKQISEYEEIETPKESENADKCKKIY